MIGEWVWLDRIWVVFGGKMESRRTGRGKTILVGRLGRDAGLKIERRWLEFKKKNQRKKHSRWRKSSRPKKKKKKKMKGGK